MENHLGELWSIFNFLLPGFLGDRETSGECSATRSRRSGDQSAQRPAPHDPPVHPPPHQGARWRRELRPRPRSCARSSSPTSQRDLYESVRLAMHAQVREEIERAAWPAANIAILEALLKLRQVCCDPRLLESGEGRTRAVGQVRSADGDAAGHGRERPADHRLLAVRRDARPDRGRADRPRPRASSSSTGQTKDRETPVDPSRPARSRVFLICLKAGGTGLTSPRADTVIHFDPGGTPPSRTRPPTAPTASARTRPSSSTSCRRPARSRRRSSSSQARKRALVAGVLSGSAAGLAFTEDDVEALFAPLPE